MARQRESIRVADPFKLYLKHLGWHCENIHGNQYQSGLPDAYVMHGKYSPRWVEFKVIEDNGSVHLTSAQQRKWPIWIAHGVNFWVIAARDMRGVTGKQELEREYKKLFGSPNAHLFLTSESRRLYVGQ